MYDAKPDANKLSPIELAGRLVRGEATERECTQAAALIRDLIQSERSACMEVDRLIREVEQLRKILSHVPGMVAIRAKEAAGFADYIRPM